MYGIFANGKGTPKSFTNKDPGDEGASKFIPAPEVCYQL